MCKLMNKDETREYKTRSKMAAKGDELKMSKKCMNELLLPIDQLDNTILSMWLEIGELSATHTCVLSFLDGHNKNAITNKKSNENL